jgi:UDP-galactopyranose mutase
MSHTNNRRVNDLINDYLDCTGYRRTLTTFHEERQQRQESNIEHHTEHLSASNNETRSTIKVIDQQC